MPPPPTIFVHPDQPLSDACAALVRTHARRLPLVDRDDQTGQETIISVLTQYRVLKFIAINVRETDSGFRREGLARMGLKLMRPPSTSHSVRTTALASTSQSAPSA